MDWLLENWFSILIFVLFISMHIFGHGGHGGDEREKDETQARGANTGSGGHQH